MVVVVIKGMFQDKEQCMLEDKNPLRIDLR